MHQFPLSRRQFLTAGSTALAAVASPAWAAFQSPSVENNIAWYDAQSWGVEGKGWNDTARYYDRLPARAEGKVRPPVWSLSRHSAGMLVRFETDSPEIHARYELLSANLAMPHMPATGVSGLDLYARDEKGRDRWLAVAQPTAQKVTVRLAGNVDPLPGAAPRLYTVYLPLYNGVQKLEIGVRNGSSFKGVAPRKEKPILFYGTSIMHGACASRAGMSISAIVGRVLNRPTINLGFSGNGQMEPEVGALLAELDPAVYAIDCLPNMNAEMVASRAEPLVRQLRAARPNTPILMVEDRTFTNASFIKSTRERHEGSRRAFRAAYEKLKSAGFTNLGYLRGDVLLGDDGEAATDGSHPNDLGMVRYAEAYVRALKRLLPNR
jgi:lysophospholipase L1-like esterase